MVGKQCIGRFMDFFFENMSPLNEYFRDMSDVPYVESQDIEFGVSQEEKIRVRSSWEELLLRRNQKQNVESHMAHKSYMWKALSQLIKYCRQNLIAKRNPAQIGKYDLTLTSNEKTLLTPEAKFVERVINDATQKIGYRSLADVYTYLSYEDPKITTIFINSIKSALSDGDYGHWKAYFRCFLTLLKLNDSLSETRTKELLTFFTGLMEENRSYFIEMDNYTTFLVKLIKHVETARTWLLANAKEWNWVINWMVSNPSPPMGMVPGQIRLQKRRTQMGYGMLLYDLQEYRSRSMIKVNKLKDFLDQKPIDTANVWDSDEDLSEHPFQLGDKIDIDVHNNNRWTTGEIETILGEMVNVSYQEHDKSPSKLWTATDSDNIAPHKAMQSIQEEVQAMTQSFYQVSHEENENQGFNNGMDPESGNSELSDNNEDFQES